MKYFKNIGAFLLLVLLFTACNFIEPEEFTLRTHDQISRNYNYLPYLRAAPYAYLPSGYNTIGNSWLASACDEAEEVDVNQPIQNFNFGNWNQYSNPIMCGQRTIKGLGKQMILPK